MLTIVQNAAALLRLPRPLSVASSTAPAPPILLSLLNQSGFALMKRHEWQALTVEVDHTTVATQVQTGALPEDFDRLLARPIIWNTSRNQLLTKAKRNVWASLRAGQASGNIGYWRLLGNELNVLPVQTAGETIQFEYISKYWAETNLGVAKLEFTADSDESLIPEKLLELDLVWRYRQSRGFAYAEDMATAERAIDLACSQDRGIEDEDGGEGGAADANTWHGAVVTDT